MKRRVSAAVTTLVALSLVFACTPIVGTPLSEAPLNTNCQSLHPCDAYDVKGAKTKPQCNDGRCDFGRPDFAFTVVINVPDSSFYAPARTFVLTNTDLSPQMGITVRATCIPPQNVCLPSLVAAEVKYRVTPAAAAAVGIPLTEDTSIPVRVEFVPLLENTLDEAVALGIPLDPFFASSRLIQKAKELPAEVSVIDTVSVGRYRRIAYPEPPYDAYFPPAISTQRVSENFLDDFHLGADTPGDTQAKTTPLDDTSGDTRLATVTRAEGLDGWQVWLADATTGRRISSLRTLTGTKAVVRLDTVGQSQPTSNSVRDDVDAIVAPPDGYIGVPRLQTRLISGAGLDSLGIPSLPAPASVTGVVAHGEGTALTGIPARLLFTSNQLRLGDGTLQPLLHYTTSVSTDTTGHFATVLPPGLYDVTVEPAEGYSFSKVKDTFDTATALAKTYRPPPRTVATGRVVLADGRPVSEADVLALPSADTTAVGTAVTPRPARTRTDRAGGFLFEVDQGQYNLAVDPSAGTGFPRVLQLRSFGTGTADIGDIQVPPPAKVSFILREPSQVGNPIVGAMVRIFAVPPGRGPQAVEIGRAMTDAKGNCEILLAQQPR